MKKLILSVCILFSVFTLGQAQNEPTTLFGLNNNIRISGFGGPTLAIAMLDGTPTFAMGGGGAVMINHFFVGGYGLSTTTNNVTRRVGGNELYLNTGQGGIWIGYDFQPSRLLHFTASTRVGWGSLDLYRDSNTFTFPNNDDDYRVLSRNFGMVTPELGVEVNLTYFFKIALTGGYQIGFYDAVTTDNGSDINLNGAFGALTFKFGWFGSR